MNQRAQAVLHEHRSEQPVGVDSPLEQADPAAPGAKAGPLKIGLDRSASAEAGHDPGHGGHDRIRRLCLNCGHFVAEVEDHHGWCVWALGEINAGRSGIPAIVHGPRDDSPLSACGGREARKLAEPDPAAGRRFERVVSNWSRVTCEACLKLAAGGGR